MTPRDKANAAIAATNAEIASSLGSGGPRYQVRDDSRRSGGIQQVPVSSMQTMSNFQYRPDVWYPSH